MSLKSNLNALKRIPMLYPAYGATLNWLRMRRNASTIHRFDRCVPNATWNGAAFFPGMIEPPEIQKPATFDSQGMHLGRHFDRPTAQIVAKVINELKARIVEYIGWQTRLDDLSIFWMDPAQAAKRDCISGTWHDDNVGHRLKVYICLKGDGTSPTIVLPNSHRHRYRPRLSELFRVAGMGNTKPRAGQIELRYHSGDVAIFDTNALHRGLYEEGAGERVAIVAEFIDRRKSDRLAGTVSCGPGGNPKGKVTLDAEALAILRPIGLLDERLIAKHGDVFSYSLRNASSH